MPRPQLHPGLRRLWRDQTTLQLGLSPAHGTVLTGLRDGDEVVLAALDGRHDLSDLHALARTRSLPVRRVDQLLRVLGEAGVLVAPGLPLPDDRALEASPPDDGCACVAAVEPAPRLTPDAVSWALAYQAAADRAHDVHGDGGDEHPRDGAGAGALDPAALIARRATAHVRVDGLGRLGAAVATTLAGCGVGRVEGSDTAPVRPDDVLPGGHHPDDVGTSRAASLARALDRALPRPPTPRGPPTTTTTTTTTATTTAPSTAPGPDLVVLVRDDAVELAVADHLVHRGVPHLAVVVAADRVVVGPLVVPGCGPCLRCLHLHRCDRDPAWPQLVAQLTRPSLTGPVPRGEAASATAAAGLAALQALTYLDGVVRPVSLGRTLDLALPDGLVERRRWTPHPRCGCTRLPGPLPASGPTRHIRHREPGNDRVVRAR